MLLYSKNGLLTSGTFSFWRILWPTPNRARWSSSSGLRSSAFLVAIWPQPTTTTLKIHISSKLTSRAVALAQLVELCMLWTTEILSFNPSIISSIIFSIIKTKRGLECIEKTSHCVPYFTIFSVLITWVEIPLKSTVLYFKLFENIEN